MQLKEKSPSRQARGNSHQTETNSIISDGAGIAPEEKNATLLTIAPDKPILVPDGCYEVALLKHETWLFKGRYPKVTLVFEIQTQGQFYGRQICAFYNAEKLKGKPKKGGHFSAGWKSDFMLDFSNCFGAPLRKDRISMCRFKGKIIKVKTRTVTHNREQREYPEGLRYSVVDRLEEVLMG